MNHVTRLALLLVAGIMLTACAAPSTGATPTQPPLTIADTEGSEISRLTLSASAAGRLGIETAAVTEQNIGGVARTVVPYASIIYAADGTTWAYTNPEGLVFVREQITIDEIQGTAAILTAGPAVSTLVVTVGGAELWGAEHGVGGGH